MNIFDPYGDYSGAELNGGVVRDSEKGQYVVDDLLSLNLYTYCQNRPIIFQDFNGHFPFLAVTGLIGLVVGAVVGGISAAQNGGNIISGAVGGAVAGGLVGVTLGAASWAFLTGAATASTLAVATGLNTLAVAINTGGLIGAASFIMQNLRNATTGFTVLGHYPGYLELAEKIKASVFEIPNEAWNKLTDVQKWSLNQEFLDKSIERGDQFIFSVNAYSA
jgi:hypothetical protein